MPACRNTPANYVPSTGAHVVSQLQLLLFSGLAFFLMLGWLKRTMTITLDLDWFYRAFGLALAREFDSKSALAWARFAEQTYKAVRRFLAGIYRHHGPQGVLARTWPTGSMAFWTTFLLGAYLIAYYL